MVELTALSSALTSLKAMKDIGQALLTLRDAQASQAVVLDFQRLLLEAHASISQAQEDRAALVEKVSELEKQITNFVTWETEKKRYALTQVSDVGVFAYVIQKDMQGSEPFHMLCTNCYENRKKSILQALQELRMRRRVHRCPACMTEIEVTYVAPPAAVASPPYDPLADY